MTARARGALGCVLLAAVATCASGAGCDSCRRPPPRILLPDVVAPPADAPSDAESLHTDGAAADAQAVVSGPPAGDGSSIELDGVTVRAAAGTRFTQMLVLDADGDGDRDLVATSARADGTVAAVQFFRREPAGLVPVAITGPTAATPARIAPTSTAQIRSTSAHSVVVVYRAPPAAVPPAGSDAGAVQAVPASQPLEEHVVIALSAAAPQVRARVALLAPPPGDTVLDMAVATVDRDGNGRDDVVVSVGARRAEDRVDRAARADLVWLDRDAGLARDTSEPEASFRRLGAQLRALATRRRAQDLPAAFDRVVRLRRAICADGGAPRVSLGSELGVPCAGSSGLHDAVDALARGYLALGEYPAAVALTRPETASELGAVDPSRVLAELRRPGVSDPAVVLRAGPFVGQSLDATLFARAPALVLEPAASPTSVRLRGPVTATVDLATLASVPGPIGDIADVRARSADGALELAGFFETCDGEVAAFCNAADAACRAGGLSPRGRLALPASAVLARLTALPSAARAAECLTVGAADAPVSRAVDVRAMGFGRDALLVAWRGRLLRARPGANTAAAPVGPGEPLGGPFPPGSSVSESGQYAVVASTEGLFVRDGAGRWRLWAPAELAQRYRQLTDLTISNDGQTVAALLGGQLEVFTHAGAVQPAAPAPQFVPGAPP